MMWSGRAQKRIKALEERQQVLEAQLRRLLPGETQDMAGAVDQALRELARKVIEDRPQFSYFNERMRAYELALFNVKQLGYEFARRIAQERLDKVVESPPEVQLKSSLCRQADIESDWFAYWCGEMQVRPCYHRKLWELAYICQALWQSGKLVPGSSGIGFGCGGEPLPSVFAKHGARVLATDLDPSRPEAQEWRSTNQYLGSAAPFRQHAICPDERRLADIDFRPVDMNEIPDDLDGQYDFCWSSCALEHLGSIEHGLRFIERSLGVLRPGGIAVHTTEFNLSEGETIDHWITVLYQKRHLQELAERLEQRGFRVAPLDFDPGSAVLDGFVDIPPWSHEALQLADSPAHLKLCVDGFPCTSMGVIVQVPPGAARPALQ